MKKHFNTTHLPLTAFFGICGSLSLHGALTFEVANAQKEISGTSTDVTGSGSTSNFDGSTTVGDFAVFDIDAVGESSSTDFADLRVTYQADNGSIGSDMMIARTSNSQGLEDTGTISVLLKIGNTGGGTAQLAFEWFAPGSFDGGVEQGGIQPLTGTDVLYTTFDIDFEQLVSVQRSEVQSYTLDGSTKLTATDDGTTVRFEDSGANSQFDDPTTAAQFLSSANSGSQTLSMGKQKSSGNALFMFEFRDPSQTVTFTDPTTTAVPEPRMASSLAGFVAFVLAAGSRRRRS